MEDDDLFVENDVSHLLEEQREKAFKYDCLIKNIKEKLEELNKIDQQTLTDISYIAINSKIQVLKELLEE